MEGKKMNFLSNTTLDDVGAEILTFAMHQQGEMFFGSVEEIGRHLHHGLNGQSFLLLE